jgi:hypothetical protein
LTDEQFDALNDGDPISLFDNWGRLSMEEVAVLDKSDLV